MGLEAKGLLGRASDLIDRGYGQTESNFYFYSDVWDGDILTIKYKTNGK